MTCSKSKKSDASQTQPPRHPKLWVFFTVFSVFKRFCSKYVDGQQKNHSLSIMGEQYLGESG